MAGIGAAASLAVLALIGAKKEEPITASTTVQTSPPMTSSAPKSSLLAASTRSPTTSTSELRLQRQLTRSDAVRWRNSDYLLVLSDDSWDQARQKAANMGGHLATVTSREENEWIIGSLLSKLPPEKQGVWMGGIQETSNGPWKWISGEGFAYAAWMPGEPNGAFDSNQGVHPFSLQFIKKGGRWGWNDASSNGSSRYKQTLAGYLVEWEVVNEMVMPIANHSPALTLPRSLSQRFSAGQWVNVFGRPEDLKIARARYVNGWIEFDGSKLTQLDGFGTALTNAGIRVTCRHVANQGTNCRLQVRMDTGRDIGYVLSPLGSGQVQLVYFEKTNQPLSVALKEVKLGDQEVYTMELAVIGQRLVARVNGDLLGVAKDDRLRNGRVIVNSGTPVKEVELINLDGLLESEALRLIGVDETGKDLRALLAEQQKKESRNVEARGGATLPELAALQEQYHKLKIERVHKPFETDVGKLNVAYVSGLDRVTAEEKKAGHLDGVLALEQEKQFIATLNITLLQGNGIQDCPIAADNEHTPASLRRLRDIYRISFAKIGVLREANLKALTEPLGVRLRQLESELTKQDRIAEAQTVKVYRASLDGAEQAPLAGNQPTTSRSEPAPATTKEVEKSSTVSTDAVRKFAAGDDRKAAEWVLAVGGTVDIEERGARRTIRNKNDLPKGSFDVVKVWIDKNRSVSPPKETFTTLEPIAGLKKLSYLETHYLDVRDADTDVLASLSSLTTCRIYDANNLTAERFALLRELNLRELELQASGITRQGAKEVAKLKQLTLLSLASTKIRDADLEVLSDLKGLRQLKLHRAAVTAEGLKQLRRLSDLEEFTWLLRPGTAVQDTTAIVAAFPKLKRLTVDLESPMPGSEVARALAKFPTVVNLTIWGGPKITDDVVKAVADALGVERIWVGGGAAITDRTLETLSSHRTLKSLRLDNAPNATTNGLLALTKLKTLNRLEIPNNPQFSEASVASFKSKRPDVNVTR